MAAYKLKSPGVHMSMVEIVLYMLLKKVSSSETQHAIEDIFTNIHFHCYNYYFLGYSKHLTSISL